MKTKTENKSKLAQKMTAVPLAAMLLMGSTELAQADSAESSPEITINMLHGAAPEGSRHGAMPQHRDEISSEHRVEIWRRLNRQRELLPAAAARNEATATNHPVFGWPLRAGPQLSDPGYSGISNFVDHDPGFPNALRDFQCGSRTYDSLSWDPNVNYGHLGTDYFTWPFGWQKMQKNAVEVISAAPGIILGKDDGNPDQSCGDSSTPWNAVYVQHDEGSIAWYGHLKKSSLTSKAVGASVAAGEKLGVVGSSGMSTGPHLHMEIYDKSGALLDPYLGACNSVSESWWKDQRAYFDSGLNQVTTGRIAPVFPTCPGAESPNVTDNFIPGDRIYFTNYYRDQLSGQVTNFSVTRPDGSLHSSWTGSIPAGYYSASWWYWWQTLPSNAPTGTWKYSVTYQGKTIERFFNVNDPTHVKVKYPNGGETVARGSKVVVKWQSNIGGHVRIELWQDGAFLQTLALDTPNDGKENWKVAQELAPGKYKIKVVDLANEDVADDSNKAFTVQ